MIFAEEQEKEKELTEENAGNGAEDGLEFLSLENSSKSSTE